MKKTISLLILLCFTLMLHAQVSKTVNVTAGGLSVALTVNEKSTVNNLTITGTVDARDFKTMRDDMPSLGRIDLSGAAINEYNGSEGTSTTIFNYAANTVPQYAFFTSGSTEGKTSLESVLFASTVKTIGDYAFGYCTGLTDIYPMLSSVNEIDPYAFWGCSGLTSLDFPPSVTSIGNLAFGICIGLTSINIPSTVSFIEMGAFGSYSCMLTVDPENQTYSSVDGILFDKSKNTLIQCPGILSGHYSIPSSVSKIADYAFFLCSELTSVDIPSSVTSIGQQAFSVCTGLTSITLPLSLTSIGKCAFQNCNSIKGDLVIPSSVTSIGYQAFEFCIGLTSVTIPSSVSFMGDYAFSGCSGLKSIVLNHVIPFNLNAIPNVFGDVDKTKCVLHVPYGTKTLYSSAQQWKDFKTIEENPSGFLLGAYSMNLESEQGSNATVTITANVSWTISSDQSWLNVAPLSGSGNKEITISATEANYSLIPRGATFTVSSNGFASQTISVIQNGESNTISVTPGILSSVLSSAVKETTKSLKLAGIIDARDFVTMRDSMPMLAELDLNDVSIVAYLGAGGTYPNTTEYPANVIPQNAFFKSSGIKTSLTSIVFPKTVTSIGPDAFNRCLELKKVTFPASLVSVDRGAFYMCKGLTSVNFPSSITSIGDGAFNSCENINLIQVNNVNPIYLQERSTPFNLIDKAFCKLYVPIGSKNAYQNAVVWKDFTNIVEGEMPLGNETLNIGNERIILYPNPFDDELHLSGLKGKSELVLFDLNGKRLISNVVNNHESLSVGFLPKGTYIVRITTVDGIIEKKLMKE